jgi:uncharacterized protein
VFFEAFMPIFFIWRVFATMCFGMALFKLGVLSAARSRLFYGTWLMMALVIAVPVILLGVQQSFHYEWDMGKAQYLTSQYNYWASILMAMGWIGLVMLICKAPGLRGVTRPFAAAGRMAFTNYIMQTVICTTIFYGHGFGLYGSLERWQMLLIVFGVWAIELIWSPLWLRYFRFGPLEWLWRTLSYWRVQPIVRRTDSALAPATIA